jgi:predicted metal-dependent peptidase
MQMRMVADPDLPAIAATDCVRHIWYNPVRTAVLDAEQLGFVLAHEVGHAVYASFERQRGRDPHLWNMATDYAINRIVASIPAPSGRGALYRPVPGILLDRRFDGLIAEGIYERLVAEGEGSRPSVVSVNGLPTSDHGGGIDVHLPSALDPEAREQLADRVRAAIGHAQAQAMRGDIPAEVARAFAPGRSRVPWQRVFRRYVSAAVTRDEYDTRRPNRRWASQGFIVPSLAGERVGTVVVALDTSGSMTPDALAAACAEISLLAREVQELRLLVADAQVQEVVTLDELSRWLRRGKARGGGGTDHRPVFDWIRANRLEPDVFVGLSDLHSRFPDRAPSFPVLWVAPPDHGKAPFGRVIEVTSS